MKAIVKSRLQPFHLSEKSFVYITYGAAEYDIFITKVHRHGLDETIEFIADSNLKLPIGAEFYIGKKNDTKLKMQII